METITKRYVGRLGWSTNTKHVIVVDELVDGSGYKGEPYAICKPFTTRHYRIGAVNAIQRVDPTGRITCKDCLRRMTEVAR